MQDLKFALKCFSKPSCKLRFVIFFVESKSTKKLLVKCWWYWLEKSIFFILVKKKLVPQFARGILYTTSKHTHLAVNTLISLFFLNSPFTQSLYVSLLFSICFYLSSLSFCFLFLLSLLSPTLCVSFSLSLLPSTAYDFLNDSLLSSLHYLYYSLCICFSLFPPLLLSLLFSLFSLLPTSRKTGFMKLGASAGLDFINVLRTAFTLTEPKSVKKTVKSSVFLRFRDLRA